MSDIDCSGDPGNPGLCEVVRRCVDGLTVGSRCLTTADCGVGVCVETGRLNVKCSHPSDPLNVTEGDCDDVQVVEFGTDGLDRNTVVVAPGHDGILHSTTLAGLTVADRYITTSTAPTNRDLMASTEALGDEEQIAAVGVDLTSTDTFLGRVIVRPGFDGLFQSAPQGDDALALGQRLQTANPLEPDTDGDLISDGFEQLLGADPRNPADGRAPTDSDGDGLLDSVEETTGWNVSVNGAPAQRVFSNPRVGDTDLDGLPDLAERQVGLDPTKSDTDGDGLSDFDELSDDQFTELSLFNDVFPGYFLDSSTSEMVGTNPLLCDTDGDKLPDGFEVLTGWTVRVVTDRGVQASQVFPDPLLADTDFGGLSDAGEFRHSGATTEPTDPTNADTDEDGRFDGSECTNIAGVVPPCQAPTASLATCTTNPLQDDLRVTVSFATIVITQGPEDGINGRIDLSWDLQVQKPGESFPGTFTLKTSQQSCVGDFTDCLECQTLEGSDMPLYNASNATIFTVSRGQGFLVHDEVNESDGCPTGTCQGGGNDGNACTLDSECAGFVCDVDISFACHLTFFRPFTYDMLQPGLSTDVVTLTDSTGAAECSFDVVIEVLVE